MVRILFSPRWLGFTLLAIAMIVTMLLLGRWQWNDARPHVDAALVHERATAPPRALGALLGPAATVRGPDVGLRATVTGRYDAAHQVLVPRANAAGELGYAVVTPLRPASTGTPAILVDRGWMSNARQERETAGPPPPAGSVTVVGWLAQSEPVSSVIGSTMPAHQLPEIAVPRMLDVVGYHLADGYLGLQQQDPPASPALAPFPAPLPAGAVGSWSLLNLAYAIQWAVFAAAVVALWVLQLRRDQRDQEALEVLAAEAEEPLTTG